MYVYIYIYIDIDIDIDIDIYTDIYISNINNELATSTKRI